MLTVQKKRCCVTQHRSKNGFRCHVLWQPKPITIIMGGTDRNDQLTKLCRIRQHYKWPRRLAVEVFMWPTYKMHMSFTVILCHTISLVTETLLFTLSLINCAMTSLAAIVEQVLQDGDSFDNRLLNSGPNPQHLVERAANASSNNRCAVCSEKYNRAKRQDPKAREADLPKRSKTVCRCCKVYLCVGVGADNCFVAYHSRSLYWR